jgi:hypothetical protein
MDEKIKPHANTTARPSDALPTFVPNKHILFMEKWRKDRALNGLAKLKPAESSQWIEDDCPSFMIITHDREGNERPDLSNTRYDTNHPACPFELDKDGNRKPIKYKRPAGKGIPAFMPLPDSYKKFKDAKTKWIAEGEGKAFALAQLGLPVLGVGGCTGWNIKGTEELRPDFADSINRGDKIFITFDGDVRSNNQVKEGCKGLMTALRYIGAIPYYVLLPENAGAKAGIDDVIAQWRAEGKDVAKELDDLKRITDLSTLDDFEFTTYDNLLSRPLPEWVVDDLIQPGELTAIIGQPNCGKSFLIQDLLSSVARGLPQWFGKDINTTGLVVHITLEGKGLSARTRAYAQHHNVNAMPYLALECSINLRDELETDRLIRSIKNAALKHTLPVVMIAVDTVNRAMGGGDENSSVDMGQFIHSVDRIRDTFPQAGIVLIHHQGKDRTKQARGHSSFMGAIGGCLLVEANADKSRTVTVLKQRDGTTDTKFHFKFEIPVVGKTKKGVDITSCVVMSCGAPVGADTSHTAIHGLIHFWNEHANEGKTIGRNALGKRRTDIVGPLSVSPELFEKAIDYAIETGLITSDKARNGVTLTIHKPKERKY